MNEVAGGSKKNYLINSLVKYCHIIAAITGGSLFFYFLIVPCVAQRPLDQDYFTANDSPQIKELLESVDFHHTRKAEDWIFKADMQYMYYALGELKYTLDTFPNHPRALQLVGAYSKIKKAPQIAIPFYEKALRLYPQYALTHAQYGGYLVDVGGTEEGIVRLKKAIEIDPRLAMAYDGLYKAYTKIGNLEMARKTAEKAKELGIRIKGGPK
jgi:tetratricopeptide (TPR) repeat protein